MQQFHIYFVDALCTKHHYHDNVTMSLINARNNIQQIMRWKTPTALNKGFNAICIILNLTEIYVFLYIVLCYICTYLNFDLYSTKKLILFIDVQSE